jgi:8-oxo-dGTP diphosphatase
VKGSLNTGLLPVWYIGAIDLPYKADENILTVKTWSEIERYMEVKRMQRTENVELTVLCLIQQNDKYLLQNRLKDDWKGLTLPGGHIEKNESIIDAVIREMKEETGLDIQNPRLCGIKQFPIENGRYIVFLFHTDEFLGEVTSSEEGEMVWVKKSELPKMNTVNDLSSLLRVMEDDNLTEFQYIIENGKWNVTIK